MEINQAIKELVLYGRIHLEMEEIDAVYKENLLLDYFHADCPYSGEIDTDSIVSLDRPDLLIEHLRGALKKDVDDREFERQVVKALGIITPAPSQIISRFQELQKKDEAAALTYLYRLGIKNYYIRKTDIEKNLKWSYSTGNNDLEITINLSKPEKNNKDILASAKSTHVKYPRCALCKENLGYWGRDDHPARENIRTVPMILNGESWFLQFSPYAYFEEHCIAVKEKHEGMKLSEKTFLRFVDFLDQFPSYFIGSNADLPIVGGSILSHEHYQGGKHLMPLMKCRNRYTFVSEKYPHTEISYLDWFNSCICLISSSREEIVGLMNRFFETWKRYNSIENKIISEDENGPHNTITPIMRKENGRYIAYLILRNNRTDEENPEGIFHAHRERHNIKKESIGLIEAMGLFILPARLKRQCKEIEDILIQSDFQEETYYESHSDMRVHSEMIRRLIRENGLSNDRVSAEKAVRNYINETCRSILDDTAVFKNDYLGNKSAVEFIDSVLKED